MHKNWQCGTPEENKLLFGEETCDEAKRRGPVVTTAARQHHCKHRAAVATKVIRLRRLRDLELIRDIDKADIYIIHLLRDPRAMFRSRSGFKEIFLAKRHQLTWTKEEKFTKLGLEAHTECENYMDDIEFARSAPWLRGRYMTVKHDAMSRDPIKTAEEVYKFVGLELPDSITDFLKETTGLGNATVVGDLGRGGSLTTQRDSHEVIHKWMKWDVKQAIRNIDKHCSRFIRKMEWPLLLDPEVSNFELRTI